LEFELLTRCRRLGGIEKERLTYPKAAAPPAGKVPVKSGAFLKGLMSILYPIFTDPAHRRVVVVVGGQVALGKVQRLLPCRPRLEQGAGIYSNDYEVMREPLNENSRLLSSAEQ